MESVGTIRTDQDSKAPGASPTAGILSGRLAIPAGYAFVAAVLVGLLLASLAVQVLGVFHRNINWDEFLFLSNTYRVANGEPIGLLQTSYAHLFGWLTRIGGDEITQIITARVLYLAVWIGSLVLLYQLARQLMDPLGALAGVVLFGLFSFSITHAASFRIDGLVLPVLLLVALFLLKPTTGRVAAAGCLSGVALALTIKASLWAPAFTGMLAVGLWHEQNRVKPLLAGTLAAIVTFAAIMLAHSWSIASGDGPGPTISSQRLAHTGSRMLLEDGFLPRSGVLLRSVVQNPVTWVLMVCGLVLTITELRDPADRRKSLLLLLLALPVASLAVYANAWPYAYIVFVPTACLLAGYALSRYVRGGSGIRAVSAALCLALATVPLAVSAWSLRTDQQALQKQVVSIVHDLFDEPVAYIDKGGMISSFPKQPVFLSRWGMKNYRERNSALFSRYIRAAHPPLLIVNTPVLDVWNEAVIEQIHPRFRLFPEDIEALRATYAHYWGPIYLAGHQWRDVGEAEPMSFEILVPGDYTVMSRAPVEVDGQVHAPGATVDLSAGPHTLRATEHEPDLRLLWGRDTAIPAEAPNQMPVYTGL